MRNYSKFKAIPGDVTVAGRETRCTTGEVSNQSSTMSIFNPIFPSDPENCKESYIALNFTLELILNTAGT